MAKYPADSFTIKDKVEFKRALRDKGVVLIDKIVQLYGTIDEMKKYYNDSTPDTVTQKFNMLKEIAKMELDANKYFADYSEMKPPQLKANVHKIDNNTQDLAAILGSTPTELTRRADEGERKRTDMVDVIDMGEYDEQLDTENRKNK